MAVQTPSVPPTEEELNPFTIFPGPEENIKVFDAMIFFPAYFIAFNWAYVPDALICLFC